MFSFQKWWTNSIYFICIQSYLLQFNNITYAFCMHKSYSKKRINMCVWSWSLHAKYLFILYRSTFHFHFTFFFSLIYSYFLSFPFSYIIGESILLMSVSFFFFPLMLYYFLSMKLCFSFFFFFFGGKEMKGRQFSLICSSFFFCIRQARKYTHDKCCNHIVYIALCEESLC